MNRRDSMLEDGNGEVWVQVMGVVEDNPSLLLESNRDLQACLVRELRLEGEIRFPLPRLVSLLKNPRWRVLTTRWCATTLGRQTFQVSSWEWLISFRIDDVRPPLIPDGWT